MASIKKQLIVNHAPGDETRIALLENGRLEEIYTEREAHSLHVGNIYLGKVVNVEAAIQAAFIDFGVGRNGFLHVSDLHPMHFPGEDSDTTEAVGQKTPHRQRPPIQHCLKRGQQILVQVLKEGIGTKGPTLTSYLSIPGRLLVMMPHMEQLGVSRKVEDLDQRRAMRKILDSLELPEGFGFILRTAGLTALKTELKRDLAYLQRLWKTIENQRATAKAPAELYVESDLLIRTIRDVSAADLEQIVVDDEQAMDRVVEFLQIVAPRRKGPEVVAYRDRVPIFHRFGVEEQLRSTRSREVPLPGGGSIIIDSAEAMVVIDVNSGRMRQFRDAETTAFRTNMQAIDEITRQLRLRDLGGLIVLDTIDMNSGEHRRELETRLRENLKRDRAKTEFLRISQFGLIEMTRQRMRPPLRKAHSMPCPTCEGRGLLVTPDSTANEAMRDMAYWIAHPRVASLEVAVGQAVAGVLLSRKRREIVAIETETGKRIDIRVSHEIAPERVDFYAYDDRKTDLELAALASSFPKELPPLEPRAVTHEPERVVREIALAEPPDEDSEVEVQVLEAGEDEQPELGEPAEQGEPGEAGQRKRKRRRRRSKKGREGGEGAPAEQPTRQPEPSAAAANGESASGGKKKRRRRGRRGRGKSGEPGEAAQTKAAVDQEISAEPAPEATAPAPSQSEARGEQAESRPPAEAGKKKRRRRRSRRKGDAEAGEQAAAEAVAEFADAAGASEASEPSQAADSAGEAASEAARSKKKRRRRSKNSSAENAAENGKPRSSAAPSSPAAEPAPKAASNGSASERQAEQAEVKISKPRRRLYGSRRRLTAAELASVQPADEA
ncbi:MAG: Rne/Rng family ribonuclease [Phycisphaerales bacterium]|nr:Rne/Rng family ribonuclease [Phycisphaerales bacterium]